MNNYTLTKEYTIANVTLCKPHTCGSPGHASYLFDAPNRNGAMGEDKSTLEEHFKYACDLFANEVTFLSLRHEPLSPSEIEKLSRAFNELLETHALLRKE